MIEICNRHFTSAQVMMNKFCCLEELAQMDRVLMKLGEMEKTHSCHVCSMAIKFCIESAMTHQEICNIGRAALLHDCGKIFVSKAIIEKSSSLTSGEYERIKKHTIYGHHLLENLKYNFAICSGVVNHHERYDGSGYPHGLRGENISLEGRIIAIIDAYSAMVLSRPYQRAIKHKDAILELRKNAGGQFDPYLIQTFVKIFDKGGLKENSLWEY